MVQIKKGEKTREHILKTTRDLLVAQGFHNTSVSDIIAATGVKKGNLYYYFAGKEELGLAVLEDAKEEFFAFLARSFQGDSPAARVLHCCRAIFDEQQKNNFVGGCLFGNAALEMSDSNPAFARILGDVFRRWIEEIDRQLAQGGEGALGAAELDSGQVAKAIVALVEGGIMMSRVSKDAADLDDCLAVIKAMVNS
jgi:TetR/AcrR family transcriptional repressor of nem operon